MLNVLNQLRKCKTHFRLSCLHSNAKGTYSVNA